MEETKRCKCCGRELPLSEFSRNGWGTLNTCKDCVKKKKQEGRASKKMVHDFETELSNAKKMRLSDFTPRDLMEELARRGIEGTMRIPETRYKEVNLACFRKDNNA